MARKKKHKKERNRSSREDQKRDDTDHGSSRDKTKYQDFPSDVVYKPKQVKGTSSSQSPRKERPKKETWKKSEGETKWAKLTGHKVPLDRDHRALHVPWKCLPLGHGVHGVGTSSQTQSRPAASSKELDRRRTLLAKKSSAPEDPRAETASIPEGEKRKEVVKRRSSPQEDYPAAKQRTTDTRAAVSVVDDKLSQKRKELVARRSRDLGSEGLSKAKRISFTKAVHSKRSSSPVQNKAWSLTPKDSQHVSPKTRSRETQRERTGSMYGPTSGDLTSRPRLPVTFKIPKKPSASVMVPSPSAKTGPRHSGPRPAEVPSPRPVRSAPHKCSHFHEAQLVQPGPVRERSFSNSSSTSAWTEHASTECTEGFDNDQEMLLVEELHLARFDRRLTVNMEKSYGELTCMDVDTEEGASTTLGAEQRVLLIVLDTNVLLSHLDFVKKMRSLGLGALGRPTLLIPWVVLQELDALKSGTLSPEVERKARPAVHYIYTCLKGQEPRLWGQSLQQASQAARGLAIENNDDRVLHCCLQYQVLYPEGSVILCTNDKNLCSKALLSGVKALSKADLVEQAEVNLTLLNDCCSLCTVLPPAGHNEQEPTREEQEEGSRMKAPVVDWELGVCVSALESSLQGALSAVLEEEMKGAFGDLWTEIVYLKPPWTLQAVLQCFRKHWIAVFGSLIQRSLLSCVDTLCTSLCSGMEVQRGTVLTAVHAAEKLLVAFSHRSSYGGRVNAALSHLRGLEDGPRAQLLKTPVDNPSDSDSLMTEVVEDLARPPQACHEEVWALFESIWNNVCQASSAVLSALHCPPGSTGQSRPTPPPQDALSCLHGLSTTLTQLLEVFRRLVSAESTLEDAQALLTLVHTCKMAAMEPCITARDLFECLSLQEYREKLCVGGAQLMELKANLDRSAAAICGPGGGT